jgi:hypothetical protein
MTDGQIKTKQRVADYGASFFAGRDVHRVPRNQETPHA